MARLIVQFPDGTPFGGARRPDPLAHLDLPPAPPATEWFGKPTEVDEERETVTALERMWSLKPGGVAQLAYRAGQEVPVDELDGLVPDSVLHGGVR